LWGGNDLVAYEMIPSSTFAFLQVSEIAA